MFTAELTKKMENYSELSLDHEYLKSENKELKESLQKENNQHLELEKVISSYLSVFNIFQLKKRLEDFHSSSSESEMLVSTAEQLDKENTILKEQQTETLLLLDEARVIIRFQLEIVPMILITIHIVRMTFWN
jgi:hypothetical protein